MDELDRQIEVEKKGRNLPPPQTERNWYPGHTGETSKGEFIVLRSTDYGYLVKYTSGPWENKRITMPKVIGSPSHELETLKLPKDQKEKLLNIFYDEFPHEYNNLYRFLYRIEIREPTTVHMIEILRNEYPPLFQITLSKYFEKENETKERTKTHSRLQIPG